MLTVPTFETITKEDRLGLEGFFGLWSRLLISMKADNLEQTADNCATERKLSVFLCATLCSDSFRA